MASAGAPGGTTPTGQASPPSPKARRPSNNSQASQSSPQKQRAASTGSAGKSIAGASGESAKFVSSQLLENTMMRLKPPRSLPPWIDSYNPRYGSAPEDQLRLLSPSTVPPTAQIPSPSHPTASQAPAAEPPASSSASATGPTRVRRVSRDGYVEELPVTGAGADTSTNHPPSSSGRKDRVPSSSGSAGVPTAAAGSPAAGNSGTSPQPQGNALTGTGTVQPKKRRISRILGKGRGAERGRKWDHLRSAEPVIVPRLPVPKQPQPQPQKPAPHTPSSRGTLEDGAGAGGFGGGRDAGAGSSTGGGASAFADLVTSIQESRRTGGGGGESSDAAARRPSEPRAQTSGSTTSSANSVRPGTSATAAERRSRATSSRGNVQSRRSNANGTSSAPHTANGSSMPRRPSTAAATDSPWREFVQSSVYGRVLGPAEESVIVDVATLDAMQPGFNKPLEWGPTAQHGGQHPRERAWRRQRYGGSGSGLAALTGNGNANGFLAYSTGLRSMSRRRARFYQRVWTLILRHPLVPLFFRLVVLVTSVVALAIAARLFELESGRPNGSSDGDGSDANQLGSSSAEKTQAIVAIAVDTVAIPYIGYMTWDEYTGKPLGLRSPTQKISLTLMDLFFIIFKAASTTLAFESLVYHQTTGGGLTLQLSRALASFMFVGLLSWTMNFTVNVFRLVEKLGGAADDPDGKH